MSKEKDDMLLDKSVKDFLQELKKSQKRRGFVHMITEKEMEKMMLEREKLRKDSLKNLVNSFMENRYNEDMGLLGSLKDFINYWYGLEQFLGIINQQRVTNYIYGFLFSNHDSLTLCDKEYIYETLKKFEEKIKKDGGIFEVASGNT